MEVESAERVTSPRRLYLFVKGVKGAQHIRGIANVVYFVGKSTRLDLKKAFDQAVATTLLAAYRNFSPEVLPRLVNPQVRLEIWRAAYTFYLTLGTIGFPLTLQCVSAFKALFKPSCALFAVALHVF